MNFITQLDTTAAGGIGGFLPIILMIAAVVLLIVLPGRKQKKQEAEINKMRDELQVGDEITTIGGIIGKVVSIKDETLVLETTKACTKIRILKTAVRSIDVKAADSIKP